MIGTATYSIDCVPSPTRPETVGAREASDSRTVSSPSAGLTAGADGFCSSRRVCPDESRTASVDHVSLAVRIRSASARSFSGPPVSSRSELPSAASVSIDAMSLRSTASEIALAVSTSPAFTASRWSKKMETIITPEKASSGRTVTSASEKQVRAKLHGPPSEGAATKRGARGPDAAPAGLDLKRAVDPG